MVKYHCEKDNVDVNSSICPHCGKRAFPVQSEIYWCETCQLPSYTEKCTMCGKTGKKLSSDLRPVFPEEKILLETILDSEDSFFLKDMSVWNGSGNIYYANGKRLNIKIGKLKELNIEEIREKYKEKIQKQLEEYQEEFSKQQGRFIMANKLRLQQIEQEAIAYIKEIGERYSIEDMMISEQNNNKRF